MFQFDHRGIYKPDNLPHVDAANLVQFITFVLADAAPMQQIPRKSLKSVKGYSAIARLDEDLDRHHGSCILKHPPIAKCVVDALLAGSGSQHQPLAWVVMPNHVHILTKQLPGSNLGRIVNRMKAGSATPINRILGREGKLWQSGYFDRYMRDLIQVKATIEYIHENPVKAGLVRSAGEWQWSSVHEYSLETTKSILRVDCWPQDIPS